MIKVEVVTPERIVHHAEGDEVLLPTVDGILGIRTGHLPLIAPLKAGEVVVKQDKGEEQSFAVFGGFVEVLPDAVHVLADTAEHVEELDENVIREAIARAEELRKTTKDEVLLADATAQIEANLSRLRIIERKKSRSHRGPRAASNNSLTE